MNSDEKETEGGTFDEEPAVTGARQEAKEQQSRFKLEPQTDEQVAKTRAWLLRYMERFPTKPAGEPEAKPTPYQRWKAARLNRGGFRQEVSLDPRYTFEGVRSMTRQEMRTRLNWLKQELNRLLEQAHDERFICRGGNLTQTRQEIMTRREQITAYEERLERYKDFHQEIRRERHNEQRRKNRARQKVAKKNTNYERWKAERKARYRAL
jgi:hypothetical protein